MSKERYVSNHERLLITKKQLLQQISNISAGYRVSEIGSELESKHVRMYHETMKQLFDLGWSGWLPFGQELPEKFMPREYFSRNLLRQAYLPEGMSLDSFKSIDEWLEDE